MFKFSCCFCNKICSASVSSIIFFASVFALVAAYAFQYIMNHEPCSLCLYERYVFMAAALVSGIACFCRKYPCKTLSCLGMSCSKNRCLDLLSILIILGNFFLSSYHVGVEKKIFDLPATCSPGVDFSAIGGSFLKDFEDMIMSSKITRCDVPTEIIPGVSMAMILSVYCLFFVLLSFCAFRNQCKNNN